MKNQNFKINDLTPEILMIKYYLSTLIHRFIIVVYIILLNDHDYNF